MANYKMVSDGIAELKKKGAFLDKTKGDFNKLVTFLRSNEADKGWSDADREALDQFLRVMNQNQWGVNLSVAWSVAEDGQVKPVLHQDKSDRCSSEPL